VSLIDISRPLYPGLAVWPGDTAFELNSTASLERGDSINLTTLRLSAHTGTHVDAPRHFDEAGAPIDQLGLVPYWGLTQVITLTQQAGLVTPENLTHVDFSLAPRILFKSYCSKLPLSQFPTQFVYPSRELVAYMSQRGIILFGTDAPSVDHPDSKTLTGHHALHNSGIAILEGLMLADVDPGIYELVALPLKIQEGDGSPVRAVLKTLSDS